MLQSLMVSVKGAVTAFLWGHTEMGAAKGEIFAQNLSLECVCAFISSTLQRCNAFRCRWLSKTARGVSFGALCKDVVE